MKKIAISLIMISIAILATVSIASAYTQDRTAAVSAAATISATTSLSAAPASISFSSTSADAIASAPITLTYSSNYNPWKVAVYTNNTQVLNKTGDLTGFGRYQKGGLATTDGKALVALKWFAKDPGSATAVPTAATMAASYNFVKDLRDEDDPSTAGTDESWTAAVLPNASYAAIAFGNAAGGVCIDPTKPAASGYAGDPVNGSIAVYICGLFGTGGMTPAVPASAGTYGSDIHFDLYHD